MYPRQVVQKQHARLSVARLARLRIRDCEHSFEVVADVKKWEGPMLSILRRKQASTAATGCCGYSGVKQCLGIMDIKQVMLDIRAQILSDREKNRECVDDNVVASRDLDRVDSALRQVDGNVIDRSGWFSDFLAVHVAKFYGVTMLIIRQNGTFTFVQVRAVSWKNEFHDSNASPGVSFSYFHRTMAGWDQ